MTDVIVKAEPTAVVIQRDRSVVVTRPGGPTVVVSQPMPPQVVVTRGVPGPRGLQGVPGPAGGAAFVRHADAPLSALRIVWENAAGAVYPLDPDDDAHLDLISGLTLTAAPGAGDVTVQRSGPVDDSAWNWTPGRVWLGAAGALTQIPPSGTTDVLVGYAVSPTRLFLDIQDPIFQED